MSSISDAVENHLRTFIDPCHGLDWVMAKSVKAIAVDGDQIHVDIELGYPAKTIMDDLTAAVIAHLQMLPGIGPIDVDIGPMWPLMRCNKL